MTELKTSISNVWSGPQTFALALVALSLGVCGGWLVRRSFATPVANGAVSPMQAQAMNPAPGAASAAPPANFGLPSVEPSAQQLKQAADTQAVPLLEQLKSAPGNATLLAQLGNIYYDAKQYPTAIDYYDRALNAAPNNTSVRTDLGTAYWYTGDANAAIAQFEKALALEPNKADTLFNLGIVKWQGKRDSAGAIVAWQKLLDTNPNYENKEKVRQLITQAQAQAH